MRCCCTISSTHHERSRIPTHAVLRVVLHGALDASDDGFRVPALLFPFVNVSVFSSQKRDASFVPQCPHAPRGVVCIPRPRRCVQIHFCHNKSRRRCLSSRVANVARRFRTPRMSSSSSRTPLHRVRIIIVVKESSQTGGKKMLGTSTTSKSRDDARRREKRTKRSSKRKRRFFCWTRCSTNWTVTVRFIPMCISFFVLLIQNAFDERGDMSTSFSPYKKKRRKKRVDLQKLTIFFTSILFYYYYMYYYYYSDDDDDDDDWYCLNNNRHALTTKR